MHITRKKEEDQGFPVLFFCLPKLIGRGVVFKAHLCQLLFQYFPVDLQVLAESIQIRIKITQFHVDEPHEHHRVLWHLIHTLIPLYIYKLFAVEKRHKVTTFFMKQQTLCRFLTYTYTNQERNLRRAWLFNISTV